MFDQPDATEFEARIERNLRGGWDWEIHGTNGKWPWFITGSGAPKAYGSTVTKWGARIEARRHLKNIRNYVNQEDPEVIR